MGWMMVLGPCVCCERIFSFNADRVPSSSARTGRREPICSDCVVRLNLIRAERGLAPIVPLPGAYDAEEVD